MESIETNYGMRVQGCVLDAKEGLIITTELGLYDYEKPPLNKESVFKLSYNDETKYYRVKEIYVVNRGEFNIRLKEYGYRKEFLSNGDAYFLLNIKGTPIQLVTDELELKKVYKESNWC